MVHSSVYLQMVMFLVICHQLSKNVCSNKKIISRPFLKIVWNSKYILEEVRFLQLSIYYLSHKILMFLWSNLIYWTSSAVSANLTHILVLERTKTNLWLHDSYFNFLKNICALCHFTSTFTKKKLGRYRMQVFAFVHAIFWPKILTEKISHASKKLQ